MTRMIIFLVRKKLGLKKYQKFQFTNQKTRAVYYFTDVNVMKEIPNYYSRPSNVSLNWLLNDKCEIRIVED